MFSFIWRTFVTCVVLAIFGGAAFAGPIVVPTSLAPGDQYRLAFITTGKTQAIYQDINVYNLFVQLSAIAQPELLALGTSWKAVGSTASVDARDNTGTNPFNDGVGVPIFLLNDTKLADSYIDLWDGSIDTPLKVLRDGSFSLSLEARVWTGTLSTGVGLIPAELGDLEVLFGNSNSTDFKWVDTVIFEDQFFSNTTFLSMYAVSDVLTVPQAPLAIPEPSTLVLLFVGGVGLLGLTRYQQRRKKGLRGGV